VQQRLAVQREARGAVGHQAAALGAADGLAEVGLARQAEFALAAFRGVEGNDVIAGFQRGHARTHVQHHARALVTEDGRESTLGVGTGQGVVVGMADAGGLDLDQHFPGARAGQVDFFDGEGLSGFPGDGGAGFHGGRP